MSRNTLLFITCRLLAVNMFLRVNQQFLRPFNETSDALRQQNQMKIDEVALTQPGRFILSYNVLTNIKDIF